MRRAILALVVAGLACNTIESHRRSTAPLNASDEFPCDRYLDQPLKAVPRNGRCLVETSIPYDFTVVVHVPESSFYAAGHTFVLRGSPTATNSDLEVSGTSGERRAKLPVLGAVTGSYTVKQSVSKVVLDPDMLPNDATSIPVRAVYTPIGRVNGADYDPALPLDVLFASSRVDESQSPSLSYVRSLPAGRWRRTFEPEPPWAEFFPPVNGTYEVKRAGDQLDTVDIGVSQNLDDPGGISRDATVTRTEGLDGWTVFLRDKSSGRRVSTMKTLCGKADAVCSTAQDKNCCSVSRTEARKRLDTIGLGTSLRDANVEAVLAPPSGWIGVPTFVIDELITTEIKIPYPDLRPPVALEGIVAASADAGVFLAVASRVTLERDTLDPADRFLRYATTVSTDDRGRFATVVPPGKYRVTVAPLEGTGFAAFRQVVEIQDNQPITLSPPRRTRVRGTVLLGDGRPAARAEVLALADPQADVTARPAPRPARTSVQEDGTFSFDLDQGQYVLTVVPEEGTGFPRVVTRATIPADQSDVGVTRIPPPTRLGLQIVDPTTVARPIPLANVRIFAAPVGGGASLEIGSGLTNADGRVEILLAQQPK